MWQSRADHLMADREGLDQDMASKETRDSGDLQRHSQRCSPGLLGIHWSSLQMTRLPILAHRFPPTADRAEGVFLVYEGQIAPWHVRAKTWKEPVSK